MDELHNFFEELQNRYELSILQNKKLKKKNEFLKNKLEIVFKEKEELSLCFQKNKDDFENHSLICKGKTLK